MLCLFNYNGKWCWGHTQRQQMCSYPPRLCYCSTQLCPLPTLLLTLWWLRTKKTHSCFHCFLPHSQSACWLKENAPTKCSFLKMNIQHSVNWLWAIDNLAWIFFGSAAWGPICHPLELLLIALKAETFVWTVLFQIRKNTWYHFTVSRRGKNFYLLTE